MILTETADVQTCRVGNTFLIKAVTLNGADLNFFTDGGRFMFDFFMKTEISKPMADINIFVNLHSIMIWTKNLPFGRYLFR